jgi:P27 family predicted phage terminase small subunit
MPTPRMPTALKQTKGTARADRINPNEPRPARALLKPPPHLGKAARAAWLAVAPVLDRMGVLTEADEWAMEAMCECHAELAALRATLAARGGRTYEVTTREGGTVRRAYPEAAQLADAERRFLEYLRRFGLTPADRTRVSAAPPADAPSPWDSFTLPAAN